MRTKIFIILIFFLYVNGYGASFSFAQTCIPKKGVNLVDVKRHDGKTEHDGFGESYSHEDVRVLLALLKNEGVSYVRVFLSEKIMFGFLNKDKPDSASLKYFSNFLDFVGIADDFGIRIVVVPGYWIPEIIKNDKINSKNWTGANYGENAVLFDGGYASLWGDYVGSVVKAIKDGRPGKRGVYAVDVRNESVFNLSNSRFSRFDLDPKFYADFVELTNLIVSKIRAGDEGVKVVMSTYCPSLAGRSSYYSPSISGSVYSPVPLALIAKTNIDVIDLHVYLGGWAGRSANEHFNGCDVESSVIGSKGFILGEIGYSRRYFRSPEDVGESMRDLLKRLDGVKCPEALVVWEKEFRRGAGVGGFWSPEVVLGRY